MASKITVRSSSIDPDGTIPTRYTKDGENLSPPLEWSGVPPEAKSLVVMMDDPDAAGPPSPFTHWLVYGLPPNYTSLPEGVPPRDGRLPAGAAQGRNSFEANGYDGPSPPPGKPHHYHFTVAALDRKIELQPGANRGDVLSAIRGHIVAQGELVATYGR